MRAVKNAISISGETLKTGIKSVYTDINPSTLSGAIDIIVIEHPDGTFKAGPFIVRFGKIGTLRPSDKIVDIHINGQFLNNIHMKLGNDGEAYFVDLKTICDTETYAILSDSEDSKCYSQQNCPKEHNNGENVFDFTAQEPECETPKVIVSEMKEEGYLEDIINSDEFKKQCIFEDKSKNEFNESISPIHELRLSLCGEFKGLGFEEYFSQYLVSFDEFFKDPDRILNNTNLVILLNGRYYNWAVAAPILVSLVAFQTELPLEAVQNLKTVHMKEKRNWTRWFRRNREKPGDSENACTTKDLPITYSKILNTPKTLSKSVYLSSDQISSLNLQSGHNDITFTMTTKYQGTTRARAAIFLWKWYDKIVVSDIDGTITKSDVRGQMMSLIGFDWTQKDVVTLYNKIDEHNYRFIYMSARSLGQSSHTRKFLRDGVQDSSGKLPDGAVLLSPSSTYASFHREVIEKKPENFKIPCLTEVRSLFPEGVQGLFAGFGNRVNDVIAYTAVGIDQRRIFTVNPKGKLSNNCWKKWSTSYGQLAGLVDYFFQYRDGPTESIVPDKLAELEDIVHQSDVNDLLAPLEDGGVNNIIGDIGSIF